MQVLKGQKILLSSQLAGYWAWLPTGRCVGIQWLLGRWVDHRPISKAREFFLLLIAPKGLKEPLREGKALSVAK